MNSEHPDGDSGPGAAASPPDRDGPNAQHVDDLDGMTPPAQRRRVANRLLVVLACVVAVQLGASELLEPTWAAGMLTVGAYAALLLLAAAWLPMPRDGFTWRTWLHRSKDTGAAPDRLYWVSVLGGLLTMQLADAGLDELDLGPATTNPLLLAPLVPMIVVVELRRRARNRQARHRRAQYSDGEQR